MSFWLDKILPGQVNMLVNPENNHMDLICSNSLVFLNENVLQYIHMWSYSQHWLGHAINYLIGAAHGLHLNKA